MALNTDFKVKDSLYVGNSACFVSQTDTPVILSAGSSLFDIFLQEGEVATNCILSAGTGITSFTYDGSAPATVSVDATCNSRWNGTASTVQATSANWNAAYTWCTTNGNNVIDTVESSSQGLLSSTTVGGTCTAHDLGLETNDSPTFAGLQINGNIGVTGTVDGRDVASDGAKAVSVYTTYNAASANIVNNGTSTGQGNVTLCQLDGTTVSIDTGLETTDNVKFADLSATGDLTVTGDGFFNGQILSGGVDISTIFSTGDITGVTAGTGLSGGGTSGNVTLAIDGTTWACFSCQGIVTGIDAGTAITVSDNGTATPQVAVTSACNTAWNNAYGWCVTNGNNVYDTVASTLQGAFSATSIDNNVDPVDLGLTPAASPIFYGLSAITLSGDGQAITGVTATPTFPSTACTTIKSTDKFFINDDAGGATSGNKNITYANLLTDLAGGAGIVVTGSDSLCVAGAGSLSTNDLPKWNGSSFVDSIASDNGTTFTVAGSATIQGDLTVTGNFTCLDTLVSITSAIEICNHGTGPALYAEQTGANCVIACFVDSEGGSVVIDDGGDLRVNNGSITTSCNLSAFGNLAVDGNTTLGNASGDTLTINGATVTVSNLPAGTDNSVVVKNSSNQLVTDEIDPRVWGSTLIDGSGTANYLPIWSDGNTLGDSPLSSSGGLTTIGEDVEVRGDVSVKAGNAFDVYASGNSIYSSEKTFTATVGTGGTTVATFAKSGFDAGKYVVTLINGVNKTVFEVLVTYNGTNSFGTVYGIVDAQAASQLDTIDVSNASSTIDLVITSASASTTAIIHGKAFY